MNFEMQRTCLICGKHFIGYQTTKYCGLECAREAQRRKTRENQYANNERRKELARMRKNKGKNAKLVDIAVKAREAGMTYGQYVAKMGL